MPRSLSFCTAKIAANMGYLEKEYGVRHPGHALVEALLGRLSAASTEAIFEAGLHEFILDFLSDVAGLAAQIETDYRFYG
jgi:uncharacterized alpha-E superfamily protein